MRAHTAELQRLRAEGIDDPEHGPSVVIDPLDGGPSVWCNRVPEPKTVEHRVHIDVDLDGGPVRVRWPSFAYRGGVDELRKPAPCSDPY
ncbi:MAG: hypothetical protein M3387_14970 [Actinomycetota bacterium]|nr:hypothetical protein [Actinomycetota bacterium]